MVAPPTLHAEGHRKFQASGRGKAHQTPTSRPNCVTNRFRAQTALQTSFAAKLRYTQVSRPNCVTNGLGAQSALLPANGVTTGFRAQIALQRVCVGGEGHSNCRFCGQTVLRRGTPKLRYKHVSRPNCVTNRFCGQMALQTGFAAKLRYKRVSRPNCVTNKFRAQTTLQTGLAPKVRYKG